MYRVCLILCCALPLAAVDESETITRSFPTGPGAEVVVDNVFGSIRVKAADVSEVRAVVRKRLRAERGEQAAEARRDVRLDAVQEGNRVRFYVDGPFRSRDGSSGRRDYHVSFDFDLQVPRNTQLRLKTVIGEVAAAGGGAFEIESVNGGVEAVEMAGPGNARTVNGKVRASFTRNPQAPCAFKTVNGQVDVEFQPGLSADVQAKTLNGGVYTDYPATALPRAAAEPERRDGKLVYRSDRTTSVRLGNGGPELKFETVNGDIQIRSRGL